MVVSITITQHTQNTQLIIWSTITDYRGFSTYTRVSRVSNTKSEGVDFFPRKSFFDTKKKVSHGGGLGGPKVSHQPTCPKLLSSLAPPKRLLTNL